MDWSQLFLGLGLAVPATGIAYLGLRQSREKDAAAVRSGLLSNHRDGTGQVIGGYEGLVNQLQEELATLRVRCDAVTAERDTFRLEIARLHRKYGDNGV